MSDYAPDKWVMVKITYGDKPIYKILASWYGGFARGDSWKLNSGVTSIEQDESHYHFSGSSGSVYHCHKQTYGMSAYTMGVFASFLEQCEGSNEVSIELMPEETNFMELDYA